jgi:uncharacterized DUF497 family protein
MIIWKEPIEFQWDSGNTQKNEKHNVVNEEIEGVFNDRDKAISPDHKHSSAEQRYILLGKTKTQRLLYIVFTVRKGIVRVISARDINKKEVDLYEKAT